MNCRCRNNNKYCLNEAKKNRTPILYAYNQRQSTKNESNEGNIVVSTVEREKKMWCYVAVPVFFSI